MKILVIGIGQSLRGDDAAGLEIVRRWQASYPGTAGRVRVEITELPGLGLLDYLAGMDAVVIVDAVQAASSAGKVIYLGPQDLAGFSIDARFSHGWSVAETLQLAQSLSMLDPRRVALIGLLGREFGLGMGISHEVDNAIPEAVERLEKEVTNLLHSGDNNQE